MRLSCTGLSTLELFLLYHTSLQKSGRIQINRQTLSRREVHRLDGHIGVRDRMIGILKTSFVPGFIFLVQMWDCESPRA